ncbi:hypothetical protein QA599_01630 [Haloarculaceae archaeon H-GB1-1]|nr:hypothetical protein [Haloarculaceae archaeon H-GB1-1]
MTHSDKRYDSEQATLDQVFTCLSNPTRRRILTTLAERNPRNQAEFEAPDFNPEDKELESFKTELYHKDLPRLSEAGFINWDRDTDTVTRGPNFEEIRPLIELMNNHQDELPDDWP